MLVDKHFENLGMVNWRRENSIVLHFARRISEGDRLGSSIVDLRFRSGEFMLKVIPLLVNLNRLTMLTKVTSTVLERGFYVLLLNCVLKNCLKLRHLKCLGVPFSGDIFGEMCKNSIILNLRTLHFDSVMDSASHRLNSFLGGCYSLIDLHIPSLILTHPIINMYREWELPILSKTLRMLSVGGLLTIDLTRKVPSFRELLKYVNRPRGDTMLILSPLQIGKILDCQTLVELVVPYTNITNIDFINIGHSLRNLKLLDVSACFSLDAGGLRYFNLFTNLERLSIGFIFVSGRWLQELRNLKVLIITKCSISFLRVLKLVYELRNLEDIVIYNTIYQFETDFIVADYFEKEFDDFLKLWINQDRKVNFYLEFLFSEFLERLNELDDITVSDTVPSWLSEITSHINWLSVQSRVNVLVHRNLRTRYNNDE